MKKINLFFFCVIFIFPLYSCTSNPSYKTSKTSSEKTKLKSQSKTVNVHALQRKLKKLGYYNGPVDGKLSPEIRSALNEYKYSLEGGVLWSKTSDGCKFSVPLNLLKMPSIFKFPISRSDIKSFKSFGSCGGGKRGSIVIDIYPKYKRKVGLSKNEWLLRNNFNSLNYPIRIKLLGYFNKNGYFKEGDGIKMLVLGVTPSGYGKYSLKDDFNLIFTNSFLEKNKRYTTDFHYGALQNIYTNGRGEFYDSKKSYIKNGLETSSEEKNHFDFTVKLQSGKTEKYSFDDSKLISKIRSSKKDLYVYYSVSPKNRSILVGKKYKAKIVIDVKAEYATGSNVKIFGISPVSFEKIPLYKEIDVILSPSNGWRKDGKILLSRVEQSYSGKGLGVRVMKKFNGIKDKKVYIKSIMEMK